MSVQFVQKPLSEIEQKRSQLCFGAVNVPVFNVVNISIQVILFSQNAALQKQRIDRYGQRRNFTKERKMAFFAGIGQI